MAKSSESSGAKPRKATARKAAPRKSAATVAAEEELRWTRWEKRVTAIALQVVCVIALVNEFFVEKEPRPTVLVFVATVFGVPLVLAGTKEIGK